MGNILRRYFTSSVDQSSMVLKTAREVALELILNYTSHTTPKYTSETSNLMFLVCKEIENRYNVKFGTIITNQFILSVENGRVIFNEIADVLFEETINWSKIACLFLTAAMIALYFIENNVTCEHDVIVDWLVAYIESHLMNFILSHNSWKGFEEQFMKMKLCK